ncbi:MAG: ABC transporter substrate-binding protein [Acidimicrobiia bacterium]
MLRRLWSPLWLVVVLVTAACSGSGADGDDGDGTAGTKKLDGQTVEVLSPWTGQDQERFAAVLDRFSERTGADVVSTSAPPDELGARLDGLLETGDAPAVAVLPRVGLLGELAGRGILKPLPKTAADLVDSHYDAVWRELATANSELYGVWFKADNKSTLWFNAAALDGAGVKAPTTWEELQAAAGALAAAGIAPIAVGAADGRRVSDWFENVYLRTAGTIAYIDLARHQLAWDDVTVVAALRTLAEVFRPEWVAGGATGAVATDAATAAAGVFAGPPTAGFVLDADPGMTGEQAGVVEFPTIGDSPSSVVVSGDVAVLLDDSPAGEALVEFLATPEAGGIWAALGGFTSPNKDVDPSTYASDNERRVAGALHGAEAVRYDMSELQPLAFGADPDQGLWPLFQQYLGEPAAATEVADLMEKIANGIFEP